jgi:hypothetical protein
MSLNKNSSIGWSLPLATSSAAKTSHTSCTTWETVEGWRDFPDLVMNGPGSRDGQQHQ